MTQNRAIGLGSKEKKLTRIIKLKNCHFLFVVQIFLEIGDVRSNDAGIVGRVERLIVRIFPDGKAAHIAEQWKEQE